MPGRDKKSRQKTNEETSKKSNDTQDVDNTQQRDGVENAGVDGASVMPARILHNPAAIDLIVVVMKS